MLKRVAHSLGLVQYSDKKTRRNKQLKGGGVQDLRLQSENIFVKIVHEGGQNELYQHAVAASKLMEKYPGTCVALPEIFRDPHQSVLWPEEILMPGHKYIIISCKAVEKLKRKYPEETKIATEEDDDDGMEKGKIKVSQQEIFEATKRLSLSKIQEEGKVAMSIEEVFGSTKDLYTTHSKRKGMIGKKKPFVPPLPKAKSCQSLAWQPSLSTVQELSV